MAAPIRHRYVLPNGQNAVFSKDVGDSLGGIILEDNGTPRDISGDTLTVTTKLGTTSKTFTIAHKGATPQVAPDIGKYIVTAPAAQLDAAAECYIDIKNQISGEEAKIVDRWLVTVEDSDAD